MNTKLLKDQWWRLNHLYKILDKDGKQITFKANTAQEKLYRDMMYRNVICKARQLGFCLDGATRVLTADLTWEPIESLRPGQEVVAVDEKPAGGKGTSRKLRTAVVEGVAVTHQPAYRLVFEDGREVTCSGNHRWLSRPSPNSPTNIKWRSVDTPSKKRLKVGSQVRWVTRPWAEGDFEDGWYGGMLDGEGSMALPASSGVEVNCSQREGAVLDRMGAYLRSRNYSYRTETDRRKAGDLSKLGNQNLIKLCVSRLDEVFRLVGQTRPARFLTRRFWEGKSLPGKRVGAGWATITAIEELPEQKLYDLQTSTKTFIAEGFVSHNSTFIDLFILDSCLFRPGLEAAIIADTQNNAEEIFRRKIMYPYEHLPVELAEALPLKSGTRGSAGQIQLANESIINVAVSARSGTAQIIHSSELAKMAAVHPDKAEEFVQGTLGAASSNRAMIFIESTARGASGVFYDYCRTSQQSDKDIEMGLRTRTNLDWKFHFFAWWEEPEYSLDSEVNIPEILIEYFNRLYDEYDIELTAGQRAWYARMWQERGEERMRTEYPSYPAEAFEQSVKGAYFANQLDLIRSKGQITKVPYDPRLTVDTWWDIGMHDDTCIWFSQAVGREVRFIDYLEASGEGLEYYRDQLHAKGYSYGSHAAPHDIEVREFSTGSSRYEAARRLGIQFTTVPKPGSKMDSIQAVRGILPICWFDKEACKTGLTHLGLYSKKWDAKRSVYLNTPLHNEHSHCADAFQTFARGHNFVQARDQRVVQPVQPSNFTY